jgi:hypothetical protein
MIDAKNISLAVIVYDHPMKDFSKVIPVAESFIEEFDFGEIVFFSPGCDCIFPENLKAKGVMHRKTYLYRQCEAVDFVSSGIICSSLSRNSVLAIDDRSIMLAPCMWRDGFMSARILSVNGLFPILFNPGMPGDESHLPGFKNTFWRS